MFALSNFTSLFHLPLINTYARGGNSRHDLKTRFESNIKLTGMDLFFTGTDQNQVRLELPAKQTGPNQVNHEFLIHLTHLMCIFII